MRRILLVAIIILSLSPGFSKSKGLAQLPPEILADSHLLRAEQSIRDGDLERARAEIDKIILLQKEHELDLSDEFHLRHAKAAAAAALPEQALEAVVKYLAAVGRDGPHYVEALELMNQTQDEIAGRKVPTIASHGQPLPTEKTIDVGDSSSSQDGVGTVSCEEWNTLKYFRTATSKEVTACLDIGADAKAPNNWDWTPLHYAAGSNKNPAVVQALIKAGADPMARDGDKETPLHYAAKYNENPAVVQALLAGGADPKARDGDKETPLHEAAKSNKNPAVVQALIKAGADPMALNEDKWTPLHYADLINRNPAVSKALLAAGADAKVRIEYKWTPLHEAAKHAKDAGVIEALLAAGADPKARVAKYKWTPLHYAAEYNENPAVVQALLAGGADPKARAKYKWTPLHRAAINKNPAVVQALLAGGADPKARDEDKWTPLHRAAINENPAVVQALLAGGADPKARDEDKETPLHYAAEYNENPAVIQALLAAGANLKARDSRGRTPLHGAAASNENPAVVQALLAGGADPKARDEDKKTPLDLATNRKNLAVIEILRHPTAVRGRQIAAARARRKANSGPGFLAAAIGIVGGTAIAAAGGGSEEALAAGTVFAEGVISGQSPAGSTAGARDVAPTGNVGVGASGGQCEIPGYPRPANVKNLGLLWCPATVDFQARAFALQAAGAQCAIATGSSSTPAQIQARRQEIQAACARLAALGVSNCRCP